MGQLAMREVDGAPLVEQLDDGVFLLGQQPAEPPSATPGVDRAA